MLKHAFEGKLTAQWREENKDTLEASEQLLARIKDRSRRHATNSNYRSGRPLSTNGRAKAPSLTRSQSQAEENQGCDTLSLQQRKTLRNLRELRLPLGNAVKLGQLVWSINGWDHIYSPKYCQHLRHSIYNRRKHVIRTGRLTFPDVKFHFTGRIAQGS